jgi:hypothetical protein
MTARLNYSFKNVFDSLIIGAVVGNGRLRGERPNCAICLERTNFDDWQICKSEWNFEKYHPSYHCHNSEECKSWRPSFINTRLKAMPKPNAPHPFNL